MLLGCVSAQIVKDSGPGLCLDLPRRNVKVLSDESAVPMAVTRCDHKTSDMVKLTPSPSIQTELIVHSAPKYTNLDIQQQRHRGSCRLPHCVKVSSLLVLVIALKLYMYLESLE